MTTTCQAQHAPRVFKHPRQRGQTYARSLFAARVHGVAGYRLSDPAFHARAERVTASR